MRPVLEKVRPPPGVSWAWLDRRLDDVIPFQWHHHPEFELTLTLNSRGQRFVGDHIGTYDDGDLVLIGPNLPHTWASADKLDADAPHVARVMWFHPDWARRLVDVLVELKPVQELLERATRGLKFSPAAAAAVRGNIDRLFDLQPADRTTSLIDVLCRLATDTEAEPLARTAAQLSDPSVDRTRIDRVLDHIHLHYASQLRLGDLAELAALSPSGLQRLFARQIGTTLSHYVMRLRIGEASALLAATRRPIAHLASDVGFDSLANFNRQFKGLHGVTPREYRRQFQAFREPGERLPGN